MARPLTAEVVVALLQDALHHEADLQHARLQPFVADFQAALVRLTASLGPGQLQDPELAALQATTRAADVAHDDAHRALHALLTSLTLRGTAEARGKVRQGLAALYPDGLAFTQHAFVAEVGATAGFAERLAHPDVVSALAVVEAEVPHVHTWTQACVQAGSALAEALQAVDARLAQQKVAGPSAAQDQFAARNEARKLWSLYLQTVELAYPAGQAAAQAARARLLQAWQHYQAGGVVAK